MSFARLVAVIVTLLTLLWGVATAALAWPSSPI
jgi:hypothetical protein